MEDKFIPAFPVSIVMNEGFNTTGYHQDSECSVQFHGMTIRDYYAAKAMESLYGRCTIVRITLWSRVLILFGLNTWKVNYDVNHKRVAECAFEMADTMLKQRSI